MGNIDRERLRRAIGWLQATGADVTPDNIATVYDRNDPSPPVDDGHEHVPINIDIRTRGRLRAYLMTTAPRGMGYTAFIDRALDAAGAVPHPDDSRRKAAHEAARMRTTGERGMPDGE